MNRERIPALTFLTNFLIGGTERQVINLIQNHDRSRYDVHLACFRHAGPLLGELDPSTVKISEYPIATLRSLKTLARQAAFCRYLVANRIRVMHSFGFYANVFAIPAARAAGVDVIVASIRDTGDHLTPFQRRLQKWVCRAADHILVNATAVRDVLRAQGYDPSRISVIHNGIDVARFQSTGRSDGALRAELGIAPADRVVAVFARLNRLKGIEYFLQAAADLARRHADLRFLIVGDSISEEYRKELEAEAARLGIRERVVFAGFRKDIAALLAEVTISVLPSLSEGLSNVVLEGMAAGVPVVATSVGGTAEMIEDGRTGILVPPADAGAIADAVGRLLDDPARADRIGTAARERAAGKFSLHAGVRETERVYERLLEEATRMRNPSRVRQSARALLPKEESR